MSVTLDAALAGDLDAIEENVRQMVGALHLVDVTEPGRRDFVQETTLDAVARVVAARIDVEGRASSTNASTNVFVPVGQELEAHVQRAIPHPFARPDATARDQEYADRVMLTLTRRAATLEPGERFSQSLYMSPPALALRAWATNRTRGR